jgi:hypothetical protein
MRYKAFSTRACRRSSSRPKPQVGPLYIKIISSISRPNPSIYRLIIPMRRHQTHIRLIVSLDAMQAPGHFFQLINLFAERNKKIPILFQSKRERGRALFSSTVGGSIDSRCSRRTRGIVPALRCLAPRQSLSLVVRTARQCLIDLLRSLQMLKKIVVLVMI